VLAVLFADMSGLVAPRAHNFLQGLRDKIETGQSICFAMRFSLAVVKVYLRASFQVA
jgi:hypothetical protein